MEREENSGNKACIEGTAPAVPSFGVEGDMERNRQEFLEMLCNLYVTAILAVLPLYTRGTYYRLGDDKYLLFRNISLVCAAVWLLSGIAAGIWKAVRRKGQFPDGCSISSMDIFMGAYAAAVFLSFLCSHYRQTAWSGYQDWYMGALTQLLFVWMYFFISRNYRAAAYPMYLGVGALFAVTLLGLLNRLDIDPLGLLAPFGPGDWEYTHMLSTIGNINWLCGYYAVALAFSVTGFLYGKGKGKMLLCYGVSVLSLLLLCIQGSAGGIAVAFACVGITLLLGWKKEEIFEKGILLGAGTAFLMPVMAALIWLCQSKASLPGDSRVYELVTWRGWLFAGAVFLLFYGIQKRMPPKTQRLLRRGCSLLIWAGALLACFCYLASMDWGDDWGTGRGGLWRLAWEGFLRADLGQKLVGAGPDCFAEYIYDVFPVRDIISPIGHWSNSIFANAHNEWLNHLVNLGLAGVLAYLGIFVMGLRRYKGMALGIFALTLYGVYSLISFQQVTSTPLFFAVLGICESARRKGKH